MSTLSVLGIAIAELLNNLLLQNEALTYELE